MILTIDIGNSNIVFSFFENDLLINSYRILTIKSKNSDFYRKKIEKILTENLININNIFGVVVSSVVPNITTFFLEGLKFLNKKILFLGDKNVKTKLIIRKNLTRKIGTDIIANIVAGKKLFKENFIIIDMGTATTFDVALKKGEYVGSVIIPGLKLCSNSLHKKINHLPDINVKKPIIFMGNTTEESMNYGIYYGYIGMINEIVFQ